MRDVGRCQVLLLFLPLLIAACQSPGSDADWAAIEADIRSEYQGVILHAQYVKHSR
jgi:hypothetical protein